MERLSSLVWLCECSLIHIYFLRPSLKRTFLFFLQLLKVTIDRIWKQKLLNPSYCLPNLFIETVEEYPVGDCAAKTLKMGLNLCKIDIDAWVNERCYNCPPPPSLHTHTHTNSNVKVLKELLTECRCTSMSESGEQTAQHEFTTVHQSAS